MSLNGFIAGLNSCSNLKVKNMFVAGETNWTEEVPHHCSVYVLTKEKREPWERPRRSDL
jgi:hypothetical protein